jgi:hypothetical protein
MTRVRIVLELDDEQVDALRARLNRETGTGGLRDYLTRVLCSHLDLVVTNYKATAR